MRKKKLSGSKKNISEQSADFAAMPAGKYPAGCFYELGYVIIAKVKKLKTAGGTT